jgi:hypothetical protein
MRRTCEVTVTAVNLKCCRRLNMKRLDYLATLNTYHCLMSEPSYIYRVVEVDSAGLNVPQTYNSHLELGFYLLYSLIYNNYCDILLLILLAAKLFPVSVDVGSG